MKLLILTKNQLVIFISLIFTVVTISANEISTSFAIGRYADSQTAQYANNLRLTKILTISDADELEVTITGKLEKCCTSNLVTRKCCDFLTIFDSNNKEIGKFSGVIDQKLFVKGSSIRVAFKSDGRTTDEGVEVKIVARLSASIFKEIKNQFLAATTQILKQGTKEAYFKISRTLQLFKTSSTNLVKNQNIDKAIEEVTDKLIATSQTYKEIVAMSSNIMKAHQQQFEIIKDLKKKTLYNLEKIDQKNHKYQSLLSDAKSKLFELDNRLEKQKWQFSIDGYKNIIDTLYTQRKIWSKLHKVQEILETKLHTHSQRIEVFLHILDINAQIYEQSANVALLRKTTLLKLNNLINLSELQSIIADIEKSENEVRQKRKKLEHIEFQEDHSKTTLK